jgi:prepilin-type N-terminal cleavage/methylation domain-containing protein
MNRAKRELDPAAAFGGSRADDRPRARRPGMSLVELMIVVLLMGIMATLVIPHFEPNVHDQLHATAQIVVGDLDYARSLAVANNSSYRVSFDATKNGYTLKHSGANPLLNVLPPWAFRRPGDPLDEQITDLDDLPRVGPTVYFLEVRDGAGSLIAASSVEFGPLGQTTRSAETVVWLQCGQGQNRRYLSVRIDPATGLASVGQFTSTAPSG